VGVVVAVPSLAVLRVLFDFFRVRLKTEGGREYLTRVAALQACRARTLSWSGSPETDARLGLCS
jgi:hypothetical protein